MSTSGGSGGGGASIDFALLLYDLTVNDAATTLYNVTQGVPIVGNDTELVATVTTSLPFTVPALTAVVNAEDAGLFNVDTTNSAYTATATIMVSNAIGTEVIWVSATATAIIDGPGQNISIDWTTATVTAVAGTDLSWNGASVISSTAGGVFSASLAVAGQPS